METPNLAIVFFLKKTNQKATFRRKYHEEI